MRTKSHDGGRAKTSTKPSHPTVRAIPRDADGAAVPKISNESNRDLLDVREVDSKDNLDNVIHEGSNRMPHESLGHDNICTDVFDGKICIRCNEGGEVLICSESGCPVTVHAKCISCKPKFDGIGNYYCPYCWLKRTLAEVQVLRKKALTAKKDLSDFLGNSGSMSSKLAQNYGEAGKDSNELSLGGNGSRMDYKSGQENGSACAWSLQRVEDQQKETEGVTSSADQHEIAVEDETHANAEVANTGSMHHVEEKTPEHMDLIDKSMTREKVDHKISEAHKTTFVEGKEGIEPEHPKYSDKSLDEGIPEDEEEVSPSSSYHLGKHKDGPSPDIAIVKGTQESGAVTVDKKDTRQDREKLLQNESRTPSMGTSVSETDDSGSEALLMKKRRVKHMAKRHPQRVMNAEGETGCHKDEEVTSSGTLRRVQKSSKQGKKLTLPARKRKRLRWTTEEENKLKEGVSRFSKENRNIPWRKILEFGCDVFDTTRTPIDLKDKWRTMTVGPGHSRPWEISAD
ncbi:uncharacterized protein LOC129302004 isoform X2 [Prosopis cineraria]|uniref:uncharacterized protein LOC129302004 isoform X2 n=1 Tax=Prosopis cineraria TaxID=364024 RepID=UPI00240EE223|nr:uncharacterized protein LOC129302004 isoform X2 [Prosopis cineraria]